MREIPQIYLGHLHLFISSAARSRILQNEFTQSCYPSVFPFPPGPWPLLKQDRCPPHELAPASHHHHAPRQSHCHQHHHLNRHLNRPSWSIRSLKISKVTQTEWVQATFTMWILCGGGAFHRFHGYQSSVTVLDFITLIPQWDFVFLQTDQLLPTARHLLVSALHHLPVLFLDE